MDTNPNQHDISSDQHDSRAMPFVSFPEEGETFYTFAEEEAHEEGDSFPLGSAAPFQVSGALPVGDGQAAPPFSDGPFNPPVQAPRPRRKRSFSRLLVLITMTLGLVLALVVTVFAAQITPQTATKARPSVSATAVFHPLPKPTQAPRPTVPVTTSWVPQHLPGGWIAAGLTRGDALFAQRTALTFVDREEGLDYRNVGTRANHAGTMTAALFLLTPAGQARFQHNDIRVINDTLFDKVEQEQLIQAAVNATPALVQFQVVGQQQFAWIRVSFLLWQARVNQNTQHHTEGFDTDAATGQPRVHHMDVLLLRVPYDIQGTHPAMGGTGWLVSTYALDSGLPTRLQPA